jgi:hypothetical protein
MRRGLLYEKHRAHYGQDGDVLVISAPTRELNPTIPEHVISQAMADDAESANAEWLGEFRSDISSLLSTDLIEAAVDHDRPLELPWRNQYRYAAFVDMSGGQHDAACIAISHRENDQLIVDVVRAVPAPHQPEDVTKQFVELCKAYRCRRVTGDAYSGEWVAGAFRKHGVTYDRADKPKSALYLEAIPCFSQRRVSLPNHARLLRELTLLERRTARSGKDTVDHPARGSDDIANAACGSLYLLAKPSAFVGHAFVRGDSAYCRSRLLDRLPAPVYADADTVRAHHAAMDADVMSLNAESRAAVLARKLRKEMMQ